MRDDGGDSVDANGRLLIRNTSDNKLTARRKGSETKNDRREGSWRRTIEEGHDSTRRKKEEASNNKIVNKQHKK